MPQTEDFVVRINVPAGSLADKLRNLTAEFPEGIIDWNAAAAAILEQFAAERVRNKVTEALAEIGQLGSTGQNEVGQQRTGHV